jgi:response regulator RpfG family c-di-GMP phosphodiesterase
LLATELGFDGVEIRINPSRLAGATVSVTHPPITEDLSRRWQSSLDSPGALVDVLRHAGRPIVVNPLVDDRLNPNQREILQLWGCRTIIAAPLIWESDLTGIIAAVSREENAFGPADAQVLMGLASQVSAIVNMGSLLQDYRNRSRDLARAHLEGSRLIASLIDSQSGVPGHDFDRLKAVAQALALEVGYSPEEAERIGLAAMMHDVGKYRVPPAILAQANDLAEQEWEVLRRHTIWGHRLLRSIPAFELASQVARWHHERWDGHGYPDGLAGDEIPVSVTIASVADALDAMVIDRIYRDAMPATAAVEQIRAGSGAQFNPRVVDALVRLYESGRLTLLLAELKRASAA